MSESTAENPAFPIRRETPFAPPEVYARWRETEPVKKVQLPNGNPAWVLTRHADVREMLDKLDVTHLTADRLDPRFPNLRSGVIALSTDNLVFTDEPEHGVMRRRLAPSFTAKQVNTMRPGIQEIVDGVLDRMLEAGPRTDLHQAFSLPIPSLVICQLLGVPYEGHEVFSRLTSTLLSRATSRDDYVRNLRELEEFLDAIVSGKEEEPSPDDLIGRLIIEQVRPGELTHKQVVGLSMLMLVAGHETTATTLSMGVLHLLTEPDKWAMLRTEPGLVPGAVEEMVRVHSINDLVTLRLAVKDFEIGGCPVKAGEGIFGLNAAANHDPDVFPNPGELDPRRGARNHVGFGYGVHSCLGQNLARAELELALRALLDRVPTLRLDVPVEELSFKHDSFVFGLHGLPVAW